MKNYYKISQILRMSIYIFLFLCVFLILTYGLVHWDAEGLIEGAVTGKTLLVLSITGIIIYVLFINGVFSFFEKNEFRFKQFGILWAVFIILVQIYVCVHYKVHLGWDNTDTLISAIAILENDMSLFSTQYFEMYQHQKLFLLITLFLVWLVKILGINYMYAPVILSVVSVFAVDISMCLVFASVKLLKGEQIAKKIALFMMLNPGLILWSFYYYTTNLSMLTLSGLIYLILKMWNRKSKWYCYFFLGVFFLFGMRLRATLIIVAIAGIIIIFLEGKSVSGKKGFSFICGIIVCEIVLNIVYQTILPPMNDSNAYPVSHWLMMGAQGVGAYNDADVYYTSLYADINARNEADIAMYKQRISDMGVDGFVELSYRKMTYNWSYGTHEYEPSFQMYDTIYDYLWGSKNAYSVYYQQIYSTVIWGYILLSIMCMFRKSGTYNSKSLLVMLTLLGAILFYILWETNPYYSVGFVPVMYMCMGEGVNCLYKAYDRFYSREYGTLRRRLYTCMVMAFALIISTKMMVKAKAVMNYGQEVPVITQTKVSNVLYFTGSNKVTQTFVPVRDFDSINIWLTKEQRKEDSTGKYIISLYGGNSGVIFQDEILNQDVYRTIEYEQSFPVVRVDGNEEFVLEIVTQEDDEDNRLGICYYDLPVDVYYGGTLSIDGKDLQGDMRINVYNSNQ